MIALLEQPPFWKGVRGREGTQIDSMDQWKEEGRDHGLRQVSSSHPPTMSAVLGQLKQKAVQHKNNKVKQTAYY